MRSWQHEYESEGENNGEREIEKTILPTSLYQALATAFTYNYGPSRTTSLAPPYLIPTLPVV
jgi:hypothetical protein